MIPIDTEFASLYVLYAGMFLYLSINLLNVKKRLFFKVNLVIFACYTLFLSYHFYDPVNLDGAGSLGILIGGYILVGTHGIIIALLQLYRFFRN